MNKINLGKNKYKLIFALIISIVFMTIFSRSSPIYPMNEWVDVHCYFTMGRAMIHGRVMYTDLFEHKGPILYLIYAVIAYISETSFIGLYIIEILCFWFFLFYSAKIIDMYLDNKYVSYLAMIALPCVIMVSPAFVTGGSVEEMNFPFMVCSLYLLTKDIREHKEIRNTTGILIGIFAGFAFWTKFIICGIYLGEVLFVILYYIINKYRISDFFKLVGIFLLGVFLITLPVLIYCLLTSSLTDMLEVYVYDNMFNYNLTYNSVYGNVTVQSIFGEVIAFFNRVLASIKLNMTYNSLVIIGVIYMLLKVSKYKLETLLVILSLSLLIFGTYVGGQSFEYYGLTFCVFALYGIVAIADIFKIFLVNQKSFIFILILLIVNSALIVNKRDILNYANQDKDSMPQYRFAKIINQEENPTMQNYHFLDGGFYYAAEVLPNCKYFSDNSIDIDDIAIVTDNMLYNHEFDFVVTRSEELNVDGYNMVDECDYSGFVYRLYKLESK